MIAIEQEIQFIENHFDQIIDQVLPDMNDRDRVLTRELIDQEEYELALRGLAEISLRSDKPVTPALRNLFKAIADQMGMKREDVNFSKSLNDLLWPKHAG